jgi:hypothetical protein
MTHYKAEHERYGEGPMMQSNRQVLQTVADSIAELMEGRTGVFEVQAQLQQGMGLLEREPGSAEIAAALRAAEADLEAIQFTTLLEKQVPSAIARLGPLRDAIEAELNEPS